MLTSSLLETLNKALQLIGCTNVAVAGVCRKPRQWPQIRSVRLRSGFCSIKVYATDAAPDLPNTAAPTVARIFEVSRSMQQTTTPGLPNTAAPTGAADIAVSGSILQSRRRRCSSVCLNIAKYQVYATVGMRPPPKYCIDGCWCSQYPGLYHSHDTRLQILQLRQFA
jgi:hypothetical protein